MAAGVSWRWPRTCGSRGRGRLSRSRRRGSGSCIPSVTKELLFTARRIDAAGALAVGLLNKVVPTGEAFVRARELAASMTALSQLTLRASKEIVDGLVARDLPAETAIGWVLRAADGPDLQEGMRAFRERRPPAFTDRP